ncbi:MAG: hypothetical protein ABI551_14350 [Polyangiaceae bacterium]
MFAWSCGLDDTTVVSLDLDGGSSDATVDGQSPGDSGGDTGVGDGGGGDAGADSGFDAGPCPGDRPICDNGTCTSTSEVCAPPLGAGWRIVSFATATGPSATVCSAGYTNGKTVVETLDGGPSACACSCAHGDEPSCMNATVTLGSGSTACTGPGTVPTKYPMTNGCNAFGGSISPTAVKYEATVSPSTACSGLTDASFPDPDGGVAQACELASDAGVLCQDHRSCVPKPASGKVCVAHAAPAMCPTGFVATNVADSFTDTRSCPACACAWDNNGCTGSTVTLHTAAACAAGVNDAPVSQATCDPLTGVYLSLGVTGTNSNPTCGVVDGGVLDGGVAITNAEVICCSP